MTCVLQNTSTLLEYTQLRIMECVSFIIHNQLDDSSNFQPKESLFLSSWVLTQETLSLEGPEPCYLLFLTSIDNGTLRLLKRKWMWDHFSKHQKRSPLVHLLSRSWRRHPYTRWENERCFDRLELQRRRGRVIGEWGSRPPRPLPQSRHGRKGPRDRGRTVVGVSEVIGYVE